MRVGSLFSGCLGLDLGLEAAGFETVWACENDRACQEIIRARRPGMPIFDDVREVASMAYRKVTAEQMEEAVRAYEGGESCGVIAGRYGVTRQAMWERLKKFTEMRPQERLGADNHFYRGGSTASDRAQNLLEKAIERGEIQRSESCETCGGSPIFKDGRTGIQAHHPDYNRPYDVMWLCQPCHHAWHREHRAVEEVRSSEVPEVDVLAGGFP